MVEDGLILDAIDLVWVRSCFQKGVKRKSVLGLPREMEQGLPPFQPVAEDVVATMYEKGKEGLNK